MREVEELCRGKLNLFLDVVGRRGDGFHELVTVFHEIDLADELVVRSWPDAPAPRSVRVRLLDGTIEADDVPRDARNLAARAALRLLEQAGSDASVEIDIAKHIPSGAGLGGGSADAAGALRAVNRLLDLDAPPEELERIAADVGSDVPFLVRGGTALGRGRGELLEPVPAAYGLRFVLLIPSFRIPTGEVFRALPNTLPPPVSPAALRRALETGDVDGLMRSTHNALLSSAITVEPRLHRFLRHARAELGPHVQMTGSGSTLFVPWEGARAPDTGGWPFGARALLVHSA